MSQEDYYEQLTTTLLNAISNVYWNKMYQYIQTNHLKYQDVNCFLLSPESIAIYFSKKYIAIEYCGNPFQTEIPANSIRNVYVRDFTKEDINTKQLIEKIVGFKHDGTSGVDLLLNTGIYEDLILPTNTGMDKLIDLNWNFAAQNNVMGINCDGLNIADNQFVRLINCSFFDEQNGDLKTRMVKWIDFLPCHYKEPEEGEFDTIGFDISIYDALWLHDLQYQYPKPSDFKYKKLNQVNRFIEFFGDSNHSEPEITSFLCQNENRFILTMGFMGTRVFEQLICEWQSENKNNIKPDFFLLHANGYADIIEFKLPNIKGNTITGRTNRVQFNAQIQSYIAQTRVYANYFDDPNNRKWFEAKYDFKVYKPKRYLVVGRRNDFACDEWIEIKSDYNNLEIITYDDLVDTVISQFYQ